VGSGEIGCSAPGTVGGVATLWARDGTGAIYTYPPTFGSNGQPTQLPAAPVVHALTSVIKTSSDGTLRAASGGTAVQIAACDASRSQQWTLGTDGTVHALGKCLDLDLADAKATWPGHRLRRIGVPSEGLMVLD